MALITAMKHMPTMMAVLNSTPQANGIGGAKAAARPTLAKLTCPMDQATTYPAISPTSTAETDKSPLVKNLIASVTTITTKAGVHMAPLPKSGVPILGTPPAAYWMPTLINARPIIRTIRPVTSGGKANRIRPINVPMQK